MEERADDGEEETETGERGPPLGDVAVVVVVNGVGTE